MLMVHCEEGNLEGVSEILEAGLVDVNAQLAGDSSALAVAVKHHHMAVAEYLISMGANVNALNKVSLHYTHELLRPSNRSSSTRATTTSWTAHACCWTAGPTPTCRTTADGRR